MYLFDLWRWWRARVAERRRITDLPLCRFCGAYAVDARRICVDCALQ
jgi:hypothetical protein